MDPDTAALRAGWRLSDIEIEELERWIQQFPNEKIGRIKAMGYYSMHPAPKYDSRLNKHLIWMIRANPDATIFNGFGI